MSERSDNLQSQSQPSEKEKCEQEKQNLLNLIREWVKNDNEIRELKKQEMIRKNNNKEITQKMFAVMRANSIECFDINDSQIIYKKTNVKKPITQKHLFQLVNEFFKDDVEKASELNNFLTDKRVEVVSEKIVRKFFK